MPTRYRIEGSIFYITSNIYHRMRIFTRPSFIIPIIDSLNYYRYQYDCKLLGFVIMLDHIHLLIWPQDTQKVWQDSFWEQTIYTPSFLEQKLNYIHLNPVRAE